MSEVFAVSGATWRRILRMKSVYFLVFCVYVLIASMVNYDALSMGRNRELMINVSLVLNSIAAMIIALSITFEVPWELKSGAASTLLSKPLGRTQYLAGKLLGIIITGVVIVGLITIGFALIYGSFFGRVQLAVLQGHLMIVAGVIPLCAIALFFSTTLPETIATVVTVIAFFLSFMTGKLATLKYVYGGIIPDMNFFNLKAEAEAGINVSSEYMLFALVWGIVFAVLVTSVSSIIFSYKDLK